MAKAILILLFPLVLLLKADILGQLFIQAIGRGMFAPTAEGVYEKWTSDHNQSYGSLLNGRKTYCQLIDEGLVIKMTSEQEFPWDPFHMNDKLYHYDKHMKKWVTWIFDEIDLSNTVPRKMFLLDQTCDYYLYTHIDQIHMEWFDEKYEARGDKGILRVRMVGRLKPTVSFWLFDKEKKLVSSETYHSEGLRLHPFGDAVTKDTILKSFGYWYLSVLSDFKNNQFK